MSSSIPAYVVETLSLRRARLVVFAGVALLAGLGLVLYPRFSTNLSVSVDPPENCPSGIARREFNRYFTAEALQIIAHVRSTDGSSLEPTNGTTNLTADNSTAAAAARVSAALAEVVASITGSEPGQCKTSFNSYWSLPAVLRPLIASQLLARNATESLIVASVSSCVSTDEGITSSHPIHPSCVTRKVSWCAPVTTLGDAFKDYAAGRSWAHPQLEVEVVSLPDVFKAALSGVDQTMIVSTLTAPLAFALLAAVLRNARLLLITLINIAACIACTVLVMYLVSTFTTVSSQAPALILATALAMSIDYSLFLLSRFGTELHDRRRPYREAVVTMLSTSGHTVLVSGVTLCLCFLGMLLIPVSTIASMGVSAAVTVFFGIGMALVLTPALLLSCPAFFGASRRYGLGCDGTCCCCCDGCVPRRTHAAGSFAAAVDAGLARDKPFAAAQSDAFASTGPSDQALLTNVPTTSSGGAFIPPMGATLDGAGATNGGISSSHPASVNASINSAGSLNGVDELVDEQVARSCWASVGRLVQKWWLAPLVLLALGGAAVPLARPLLSVTYAEGLAPLLPRGDATTAAFDRLQDAFGVSNVFPNQIIIVPPNTDAVTSPQWLRAACVAMHNIADNVTSTLHAKGIDYTMSPDDFSGLMIFGGQCIAWVEELLQSLPGAAADRFLWQLINTFGNPQHSATAVHVSTTLNPFDATGQEWIKAVRDALEDASHTVVNGERLGEMVLSGLAPEQMDGSSLTFASLPRVIGATLIIVCIVLFAAFRSLLVPVRAVLCLAWMLVVTFGSAVAVYGWGAFGTGVSFLAPSGGALFWMSPCISFSICVGLGLDYDIFLMESVIEFYDHGDSPRTALARALASTGNIICVAGLIMTLAFGALLVGNSAALNQIGYLLIVGVLIDCFVTTKLVIPCVMALLPGDLNFWPRKRGRGRAAP